MLQRTLYFTPAHFQRRKRLLFGEAHHLQLRDAFTHRAWNLKRSRAPPKRPHRTTRERHQSNTSKLCGGTIRSRSSAEVGEYEAEERGRVHQIFEAGVRAYRTGAVAHTLPYKRRL